MRSVRFDQFGDPAAVLHVEDLPIPEAGPDEILLRLTARPINPSDLLTVSGQYGSLPKLPATPGYEGSGVIEAVGSNVRSLQVGQRIVPLGGSGTWQEYTTLPAAQVIPIPDSISDIQASMLLVNPATAWILLTEVLNVQPGEWVLQTAAGSALGAWVIKIARKQGFKTINVVRRRDQVETLRAFGADEVICTADENLEDRVNSITGGRGVPHALDAVGGELGGRVVSLLATGGTLITYGLLSGQPITVDAGRMLFKESVLRGFWLTRWLRRAGPVKIGAAFGALIPMLAAGEAESPVAATYDLADIVKAVSHAAQSGRDGKIVITG